MNAKDVVDVARLYGTAGSYGEDELLAFAQAFLDFVPIGSTVIEIGCQYGRSTSAIMQISKERHYHIHCIDPFEVNEVEKEPDIGPKFIRAMLSLDVPFHMHVMKSERAIDHIPMQFGAIHIDGDHSFKGIHSDCALYLQSLISGGIALFHDYGRCGAPDVQPVVDSFTQGWQVICQGACRIVRKP